MHLRALAFIGGSLLDLVAQTTICTAAWIDVQSRLL
jgi:hypothetical protein